MIEYIVNKEKRTVAAVYKFDMDEETFNGSGEIYIGLVTALRQLNKRGLSTKRNNEYFNKMYFPNYLSAKAKCNPHDEWNEDFGKQLARKRLVEKIHNYRSDSYKIIAKITKEISDIVM